MVVFISEEEIETLKERLAKKDDKLKNQASELNHLTNEVIPELKKQNKELKIVKKELTEGDVIKIINGYCSDNLDTQTENIQTEDIQADGKQGKRLFISWLTRNLQKIKNNGLLSQSNLEKKLNKSEETLKKEENNYKEFLNKKESYHIQTFDEMFND